MSLLLAACAGEAGTAATFPVHEGVETADIRVGGSELTVWVADTPGERSQGLRGVASLPDGIDGMLFTWESPTAPTFGMKDTLMPLDIWWFAADGSLIGKTEMPTCPDGDCVSYPSPDPVRWALETPSGDHEFDRGAVLTTS